MRGKNIFRRIAVILITIILVMGMAGCSGDNQEVEDKDTVGSEETGNETEIEEEDDETVQGGTEPTTDEEDKVKVNVASLKGPTSMGLVKIMEDNENGESANDYNFSVVGTPDEISPGIIGGDFDIAALPANLASVLYNKSNGGVVVVGINTLGVLYIVETGEQINSVEDLRGKTIYSTGKGTTPEYTLNYLLTSNGIDPEKDVTIEYKSEATEVAALLSEADDGVAMLPQPYVTTVIMNNDKVRIALDVAEEWEKVDDSGSAVTTGVVVVNKDVADKYQTVESLSDLKFAVEAGSAGEKEVNALELENTPVKAQSDALMEVKSKTSDAAVIDLLMAGAMIGEGTGYADLTYTVPLNSEEYGVGFRKGSDLASALNQFFKDAYADGSMMKCANEYGVQESIIEQK